MSRPALSEAVSLESFFLDASVAILRNEKALRTALSCVATASSIDEEILSSLSALKGAAAELNRENPPLISSAAVFHPSNVLLYSYVLYCIIPSRFVERIYVRPASQVSGVVGTIYNLFKPLLGDSVEIRQVGQRAFLSETCQANLVVFTGKYDNAVTVSENYPKSLFLYFGAGPNPFVLTEDGDLGQFIEDVISARLFNSGQDCMCPDIIFVHAHYYNRFIRTLKSRIMKLRFGELADLNADYSHIVYDNVAHDLQKHITRNSEFVSHTGIIQNDRIDPVILESDIGRPSEPAEFFSPVFNVVRYDRYSDLLSYLLGPDLEESRFGVCLYGNAVDAASLIGKYKVAHNQSLFAAENGNNPFGGYGVRASFVSSRGRTQSRPILISKEVARNFGSQG